MNEFYFIVYQWHRVRSPDSRWTVANKVIAQHPMEWLHRMNVDAANSNSGEQFMLLFFTPISETLYYKFGHIF